MKSIKLMRRNILLIACLLPVGVFSQDLDLMLDSVMSSSLFNKGMSFNVEIHVDVPGINMPDKTVQVSIDPDGKSKIKGEGLLLLPQKGVFGQFAEIRNTPNQVIFLGKMEDTLSYKIVSLDHKSDWVTADVFIHSKLKQLNRMEIVTRKYGTFKVEHIYGTEWYPKSTKVEFSALPVDLPLKFMGRNSQADIKIEKDKELTGIIILKYSEYQNSSK